MRKILADICFLIGDWCSIIALKFDSPLFWKLYQKFMCWSDKLVPWWDESN